MNGEGFDVRVDAGDKVRAGQIVATADISLIKQRGFNPITAVLITNPEKIKNIAYKFGNTIAGKDTVMYYTRKG
jgi:phosphotransferase system IIA component